MAKVVHFEIPTDDLDRAKAFYADVLGWKLSSIPMTGGEYTVATTTDVDEQTQMPTEPGAINGGLVQRDDTTPAPVLTVDVPSIEEMLREVEGRGGSVVQGRTEIPGMGAYAYVKDTEGNVLGLWES